jgi:hypothetical protein
MSFMSPVDGVKTLERDLQKIFGARLQSLIAYGQRHTLAVVDTLTADDLRACARRAAAWHDAKLTTPLLLPANEFASALDAFPLEFGAILSDHRIVSGRNPFAGLSVDPDDLRRAVEVQARSHLLHLREGFVETRGNSDALAILIVESAPAFAALLKSVSRLDGRAAAVGPTAESVAALAGVHEISGAEAERLFPPYLEAVEKLVAHVDTWHAR